MRKGKKVWAVRCGRLGYIPLSFPNIIDVWTKRAEAARYCMKKGDVLEEFMLIPAPKGGRRAK